MTVRIGPNTITAHNGQLVGFADLPGNVTLTATLPDGTNVSSILTPSSFMVGGSYSSLIALGTNYGVSNGNTTLFQRVKGFTIAFDVYFNKYCQSTYFLHAPLKTNYNFLNWYVYLTAARKVQIVRGQSGSPANVLFTQAFTAETWVTCVLQFDETNITLTTSVPSAETVSHTPGTVATNTDTMRIGSYTGGMKTKNIEMLASIATSAQVAARIAGGKLDISANLLLDLPCDEESGSVFYDRSPNNYDFTIEAVETTQAQSLAIACLYNPRQVTITTPITGNEQSIAFDTGSIPPGTSITVKARRTKAGFPTGRTPDISYEEDTCVITAAADPATIVDGVSVDKPTTSLDIGATETLGFTIYPSTAVVRTVTWASSDPTIATIHTTTGKVDGIANGSAIMTATTDDGGFTDTCVVHVPLAHVEGITLNKYSTSIGIGSTETLVATLWPDYAAITGIVWSTSDALIATASGGIITGVGHGVCNAIATTVDGGHIATCQITVPTIAVAGVSIHETSLVMTSLGHSETLVANIWPASATDRNVTWVSLNPTIATVSNVGVVTSVTYGTATIRATTTDGGFTHDCIVYVQNPTLSMTTAEAMRLRHYGQS